jgi:hypothetical protein
VKTVLFTPPDGCQKNLPRSFLLQSFPDAISKIDLEIETLQNVLQKN